MGKNKELSKPVQTLPQKANERDNAMSRKKETASRVEVLRNHSVGFEWLHVLALDLADALDSAEAEAAMRFRSEMAHAARIVDLEALMPREAQTVEEFRLSYPATGQHSARVTAVFDDVEAMRRMHPNAVERYAAVVERRTVSSSPWQSITPTETEVI